MIPIINQMYRILNLSCFHEHIIFDNNKFNTEDYECPICGYVNFMADDFQTEIRWLFRDVEMFAPNFHDPKSFGKVVEKLEKQRLLQYYSDMRFDITKRYRVKFSYLHKKVNKENS